MAYGSGSIMFMITGAGGFAPVEVPNEGMTLHDFIHQQAEVKRNPRLTSMMASVNGSPVQPNDWKRTFVRPGETARISMTDNSKNA